MKRTLFSLLAALCLTLLLLPATAEAADSVPAGLEYAFNGDKITITDYTGSATELVIPATIEGMPVTTIGDYAFEYCDITSVTIPDSVTTIGFRAFRECRSLTGIFVDSANPVYCSDAAGVLYDKEKTTLLQAPGAIASCDIPDSVTIINEWAFAHCYNLTSVTIPDGVTTFGWNAFYCCTSLVYNRYHNGYYLGNAGNPYVALIEAVDTDIPSCQIHANTKVIGAHAFENCDITSVTIPDSVTTIGGHAFRDCDALTGITIPDSVTTIGDNAFEGCTALTSVTIGDSVMTIGVGAFYDCDLDRVTFTGNLPTIGEDCFLYTRTTAYYPCNNDTWTDAAVQALANAHTSVTWKANHSYKNNVCTVCGDKKIVVDGVDRVYGSSRYDTAFQSADTLKKQMGVEKFSCAIVTSGDNFADALAGSYLAYVKNAPILLTDNDNIGDVMAYIQKNVASGATVYALGGKAVVTDKLLDLEKKGYDVKRLAGKSRFETNLEILKECGSVAGKDILVCTGFNFADSLSASAAKRPILLVDDKLTDGQKAYLKQQSGCKYCIVGGTGAVTSSVEKSLKSYGSVSRLAGSNRFETSVMVAKKFFSDPTTAVLAYGYNFPDGLCAGPLAATINAPLILTATGDEAQAAAYAKEEGIKDGYVLGGSALINDKAVKKIFSMGSGDKIK